MIVRYIVIVVEKQSNAFYVSLFSLRYHMHFFENDDIALSLSSIHVPTMKQRTELFGLENNVLIPNTMLNANTNILRFMYALKISIKS